MKKTIAVIILLALCLGTLTGCGKKNAKTLKVGGTPTPHCEILEVVKPILAAQGIELEIVEMDDYVIPNTSVEDGSLDANFFQHTPYLDSFNSERGTHLVSVCAVHYEPLGLYSQKHTSLQGNLEGAEIAVPNDTSNEARALLLLEANGVIKLRAGAGINATVLDIEENPYNVKITELEAAQITAHLKSLDFAVINGNYAIQAGLSVGRDALAAEKADSEAAKTYGNILVVKKGNENNELILALKAALQSEEVRKFIESTYDGSVVPVF